MSASLDERRALEALRNGVPNGAAIRTLGCEQAAIEERFRQALDQARERAEHGRQEPGLVVQGDFGSGKSHLLGYLAEVAREANFVCSRVVISKETPLYDAGKMFRAAIESAVLPDARGVMIEEIDSRLTPRKDSPAYTAFYEWAADERSGLWPGFAASLKVWESPPDDVERAILDFWSGQPLPAPALRRWLSRLRLQTAFVIRAVARVELPPQHVRFAARLFQAAGYAGWVILLDEVELVGRYSILQRARSYAELARWLGLSEANQAPGVLTVGAITEDFAAEILDARQDWDLATARLRDRGDDAGAARAELGMRAIRNATSLKSPHDEVLRATHDRLRDVHSRAYDWEAPALQVARRQTTRRMRSYIRGWITEWDLARFQPGQDHEVVAETVTTSYTEDDELERAPDE